MKKIYASLAVFAAVMSVNVSNAQGDCMPAGGCPFNFIAQWPNGSIDIQVTDFASISPESYIGDHMVFIVNNGVTYTWSLCAADGGIAATEAADSEFVLFDSSNQALLCYSDDFCGTLPRIEWTADFTGSVTLQFNVDGCVDVPLVNNTIVFKADQITSVTEKPVSDLVSIYPNPASDVLTVNFGKRTAENVAVSLVSVDGRVVYAGTQTSADGTVKLIDVSALAAGVYHVQLATATDIQVVKVLVQ